MANASILSDVRFYGRREYFAELQRCAEQAQPGDRITIMAMAYDPESPEVSSLMSAMDAAAKRGVQVQAVVDAHSFMINGHKLGPLWSGTLLEADNMKGPFKAIYESLQGLQHAGGSFHIINRPAKRFSNPYAGRSHIKLALVNDQVFIGGCNLEKPDTFDIMVSWHDAATANWLRGLIGQIGDAPNARQAMGSTDLEHRVGDNVAIYVDAGVKKQSIILQQAHRLIDEAEEFVTITCQYFPGGETAKRLLAAHKRGVKVSIYFSPPSAHSFQAPGHWLYNSVERLKMPKEFFQNVMPAGGPKLHSKIVASEKAALVGSHNYVRAGVNLGTAEIALLVRDDRAFIQGILNHVRNLVAQP